MSISMMMHVISSIPAAAASRRNIPGGPCSGFRFAGPICMQTKSSDQKTSASANFNVDWKETADAHVFKADLPGLKKEQVKVEVEEGGVLKISGERSRETEAPEEKNVKYLRSERSVGEFRRRFRLPENVMMDAIEAKMEDGVLTITVPKKKQDEPLVKAVEISG